MGSQKSFFKICTEIASILLEWSEETLKGNEVNLMNFLIAGFLLNRKV